MISVKTEMALSEMGKDQVAKDKTLIDWNPTFREDLYKRLVEEDNKNINKEHKTDFTHQLFIILIADAKNDLLKSGYEKSKIKERYDKFYTILSKSKVIKEKDKKAYLSLFK